MQMGSLMLLLHETERAPGAGRLAPRLRSGVEAAFLLVLRQAHVGLLFPKTAIRSESRIRFLCLSPRSPRLVLSRFSPGSGSSGLVRGPGLMGLVALLLGLV